MIATWRHAVMTTALRGPGPALLLASATGWAMLVWSITGKHSAASHGAPMSSSTGQFIVIWLAMILAMAPPLLIRELGRLWRSSLRRRRHLTIASFLCGYVGVWLLVGVVFSMVSEALAATSSGISLAVALAGLWHCSPARQRSLNACHRAPALRVFGPLAQWDSLRYGLTTGGYCAAACGLVMLLVLLFNDHHLAGMAVASPLATLERHLAPRRPRWQLPVLRGRGPQWPPMAGPTDRVRISLRKERLWRKQRNRPANA